MDTHQNSSTLKEGFLVKRGHMVLNWKARWFVLLPDRLMYYKYEGGKKDSSKRGTILLAGCVITSPFLVHENRPLVLRLQTNTSEEYFMEASSREERDDWAACITTAAERLRSSGGQSPGSEAPAQPQRKGSSSLKLHNVNLSQVVDSMYDVHSGIKLTSHMEQGSSFSNCFSGSAVVDWLVFMQLTLTRVEAVTLASALLEEGDIRPVGVRSVEALRNVALGEQFLDDSTALYSYSENLTKRGSVKAETSLSAVELSGKVQKRGYLLKQGHKRKNWKVRLFVLRSEPGYLHYYDPSKDDLSPVGGFSLRGCLVSALNDSGVPSGVKGKVQGNLFKIITQSDTDYFIQAPNKQEKMDWIEAIRQLT
ncbi:pleckstrin-2 [Clupea harengus]|uniref:Pleckstrin-2 n=1 Tax=Clupea harengus TaxID=7950 RepID=A0A6P3VQY7_CLUHA|nr:pleckstrin-2 [Clupea harengus]